MKKQTLILPALLCAVALRLYAADPPLPAPKVDDVAAFANDVKQPSESGLVMLTLQKERLLQFLEKGEIEPDDTSRGKWIGLAGLSLPDTVANLPEVIAAKKSAEGPNAALMLNAMMHTEGVLATKGGGVFFWKLWNDRVLGLRDASGHGCFLVLPAEADSPAHFLAPYHGFDGEDSREHQLYGKMERPKAGDMIAFANRPKDESNRYEMDKALMEKFLSRGLFDEYLSRFDEGFDPLASMKGDPGTAVRDILMAHRGALTPATHDAMEAAMSEQQVLDEEKKRDVEPKTGTACDGVLATSDGQIYFWKLRSNFMLFLMDTRHRTTMLRLDKILPGVSAPDGARFNLGGPQPGRTWYSTALTTDAILATPDWTPGKQPAPVSSAKAVQLAWKELKDILPDNDTTGWQVDSITTKNLYGTSYRKWYYKISFSNPGAKAPPGELTGVAIYVDMGGTPATIVHQ